MLHRTQRSNRFLIAEKTTPAKKLSDKNTKQEMLDAYQTLAKQLEEKRQTELNPERKLEEKKTQEALKAAGTVVAEGIDREIGGLKSEISTMLAEVSEKLGTEAARFRNVQKAVEAKKAELRELYGIEKAASTLAALIEAQHQKQRDFETETAQQQEALTREIEETRAAWQKERQAHDAEIRERDAAEKKARDREKEQFDYAFKREQQTWRDKLADEKAGLEKELRLKKETAEKELTEREQAVKAQETELNLLRTKSAGHAKSFTELQKLLVEQGRKVAAEK